MQINRGFMQKKHINDGFVISLYIWNLPHIGIVPFKIRLTKTGKGFTE